MLSSMAVLGPVRSPKNASQSVYLNKCVYYMKSYGRLLVFILFFFLLSRFILIWSGNQLIKYS